MNIKYALYILIALLIGGGIVLKNQFKKIAKPKAVEKTNVVGTGPLASGKNEEKPIEVSGSSCIQFYLPKPLFDEKAEGVAKVGAAFSDKEAVRSQSVSLSNGESWTFVEKDCDGVSTKIEIDSVKFDGDKKEVLIRLFDSPVLTKKGKLFLGMFQKYVTGQSAPTSMDGEHDFRCSGKCKMIVSEDKVSFSLEFFPSREVLMKMIMKRGESN